MRRALCRVAPLSTSVKMRHGMWVRVSKVLPASYNLTTSDIHKAPQRILLAFLFKKGEHLNSSSVSNTY